VSRIPALENRQVSLFRCSERISGYRLNFLDNTARLIDTPRRFGAATKSSLAGTLFGTWRWPCQMELSIIFRISDVPSTLQGSRVQEQEQTMLQIETRRDFQPFLIRSRTLDSFSGSKVIFHPSSIPRGSVTRSFLYIQRYSIARGQSDGN